MSTDPSNGADKRLTRHRFYKADQEASFVDAHPTQTAQTQSPSYRLAYRDVDFLLRDELRPVRFQLELLKPEMLLDEAGIGPEPMIAGSTPALLPAVLPEFPSVLAALASALPDEV